jgi:hypothetical protein
MKYSYIMTQPKHILSAASAQIFIFLWFIPSLCVRNPWAHQSALDLDIWDDYFYSNCWGNFTIGKTIPTYMYIPRIEHEKIMISSQSIEIFCEKRFTDSREIWYAIPILYLWFIIRKAIWYESNWRIFENSRNLFQKKNSKYQYS